VKSCRRRPGVGIFAEFTRDQTQMLVLACFHYIVRTAAVAAVKRGRHRIIMRAALICLVSLHTTARDSAVKGRVKRLVSLEKVSMSVPAVCAASAHPSMGTTCHIFHIGCGALEAHKVTSGCDTTSSH
jgi:hypothetical protein